MKPKKNFIPGFAIVMLLVTIQCDVTSDVPPSPVLNNNPEEDIMLMPFGCAPIRITYFPVAEKQQNR